MIKGAQKQMIVVRTGASKYFDEAYFVLKSGINPARGERTDILSEANRILQESESVRIPSSAQKQTTSIMKSLTTRKTGVTT